jgi:signal transduction histidine kinase
VVTTAAAGAAGEDRAIAIVGIGCRFPGGAVNPDAFWQLLRTGVDPVGEIPPERWDVDSFFDPDPEAPGRMYVRRGAFLESVDGFDPEFFGIAPREIEFDLFSSLPPSQKSCLNARGSAPPTLLPGFKAYLRTTARMQFQAQEWTLIFHTTPLFERESSRYRPWTAIALGAILSALVAALLFLQIHARLRQEVIAAELRSACEDLQRVQNERERISRDIHDGAIQSLYGLQLTLGHYERLRARQPQSAGKVFEQCRTTVDALIAELRTFIVQQVPEETVSPAASDPALTLRQVVQRFQSASSVPIHLLIRDPQPPAVTHVQEAHLRQIAQEAISNSLRHGHPRHIHVEFEYRDQRLRLSVLDDGAGFDLAQSHSPGQGLANMQARAAQLGGTLHIETQPGRGTRIVLEIPLEPEHHAANV